MNSQLQLPVKIPNPTQDCMVTQLLFQLPITFAKLPKLRGAIAHQAGIEKEHFHNHDNAGGNFHYRYPLVQYHVENGKAAMIGIREGAQALKDWADAYDGELEMAGQIWQAPLTRVQEPNTAVHTTDEWQTYHIHDWIALNEKNYTEFQNTQRLADQMAILEHAFVSHVLAFARGIGWFVDRRLKAELIDFDGSQWHKSRGANQRAFDATFRIQAQLPTGIGLGKNVSIGFGRLAQEA